MIVFEDKIQQLVDLIPQIDGFDTTFYWGNGAEDVNHYLTLDETPYPFIFLTSTEESYNLNAEQIEKDCVFILANPEINKGDTNNVRLANNYQNILNPLLNYFVDVLNNSSISQISPQSINTRKIPNYGQSNKNGQIVIWDVIQLKCKVLLYDRCLKPFSFS